MKKDFRKITLMLLYLFIIAIGTQSCEKIDMTMSMEEAYETTHPAEITSGKIRFQESKHINTLKKTLDHIEKVNKKSENTGSPEGLLDNVHILKDETVFTEYAGTHTYTFKIARKHPIYLIENIVLHYNLETKDYDEYLIQYKDITMQQLQAIADGAIFQDSDKILITKLEKGTFQSFDAKGSCSRKSRTRFVSCGSGQHSSENLADWAECAAARKPYAYQEFFVVCESDSDPAPGDGESDGNGSRGGGGTTTTPDAVHYNPLPLEPCPDGGHETDGNGRCIQPITYAVSEVASCLSQTHNKPSQSDLNYLKSTRLTFAMADMLQENGCNSNTRSFVRDAIQILRENADNGTRAKEKKLIESFLNKDADKFTDTLLEGATYQQCCYDDTGERMAKFTANLLIGASDGLWNLILTGFEYAVRDSFEGEIIRRIITKSGVHVASDISDETLGELFKFRKVNTDLSVLPETGWGNEFLETAISLLDVISLLSPAKGGGAFLAIRGGGKITGSALSSYLKALSKGKWKTVNENMSDAAKSYQELISGRKWNESFELNGVKFDGLKNGVLSDAKSGMNNFVNADGTFKPFFTGVQAIIDQARRQRAAAGELPIEWHFEHDIVRKTFENLLKIYPVEIKFIHTPR